MGRRAWFTRSEDPAVSAPAVLLRRAQGALRAGWQELAQAFFPPLCWLCRSGITVDGYGCAQHALGECAFDGVEPRCSGCAERLPEGMPVGLCAICRRTPRGYTRLVAYGSYQREGALRAWLLALKHGRRRDLARPLAALLANAWQSDVAARPGAVLVPVPLHPLRRLERGYDQAALLAREVAERLRLECVPALRRRRFTAPQGAAGSSSRSANVAGAFVLDARRARSLVGRSLVLVDDVVTSGATVRACAEVLRELRPTEIVVLALARVDREHGSGEGADRLADSAASPNSAHEP